MIDAIKHRSTTRKNALRLLIAFFIGFLLSPAFTHAHEIRPAVVDLNFTDSSTTDAKSSLSVKLIINLESLIAEIGPEHDNTDTSENTDFYQQLRALDKHSLLSEFEQFEQTFLSAIQITTEEGLVVPVALDTIDIPPVGDVAVPRDTTITLNTSLANDATAVRWQWSDTFGEAIVRANNDSTPLEYAALLSAGQQSELIQLTQQTQSSVWTVLKNYTVVGFEHILPKGLDHILFIIGLFLLTYQWRALLLQVTTFTLAHSITLALATTGVLVVSGSIVEPLIALSIVFVCVENFLSQKLNKWRLLMVFLFGLLHGLGFASVLGEVGLDGNHFLIALLGFNVGVELGQLFVVACCLATIAFWFGKKPYYRSAITRPASAVIGAIGMYWFIERTVL